MQHKHHRHKKQRNRTAGTNNKTQNKTKMQTEIEKIFLSKLEEAKADKVSFKNFINRTPPANWLKAHPMAKRKVDGINMPTEYLPIERLTWMVRHVFESYEVKVKHVQLILNSVQVTVNITMVDCFGVVHTQDGIGAAGIQMDAGASITELSKVKLSGVQMAAPAAMTFAEKDAIERVGKIFGSDINRQDVLYYELQENNVEPKYTPIEETPIIKTPAVAQLFTTNELPI